MATMGKKDMSSIWRSFPDEFKTDAVAMVLDDGRKIVDVAEAISVVESTLGDWVRLGRIERSTRAGLTRDDRTEIVELSKENDRLRMERDLLKRATAFWVKESGQRPAICGWRTARPRDSRSKWCARSSKSAVKRSATGARNGPPARPTRRQPTLSWWQQCATSKPSSTTPMANRE
jgi:transposase